MSPQSSIDRAVNYKLNKSDLPQASQLVADLLELEKNAKKTRTNYSFANLIGCWSLRFVTGTKKARTRAGVVLGAGRYIPKFIKIQLTYEDSSGLSANSGRVKNTVKIAFIELALTGPAKFLPKKNIVAFDFTTMKIAAWGFKLYDGYIKNGLEKEAEFDRQALKEQAFFTYFSIQENAIAARGRGGGLALWGREN